MRDYCCCCTAPSQQSHAHWHLPSAKRLVRAILLLQTLDQNEVTTRKKPTLSGIKCKTIRRGLVENFEHVSKVWLRVKNGQAHWFFNHVDVVAFKKILVPHTADDAVIFINFSNWLSVFLIRADQNVVFCFYLLGR